MSNEIKLLSKEEVTGGINALKKICKEYDEAAELPVIGARQGENGNKKPFIIKVYSENNNTISWNDGKNFLKEMIDFARKDVFGEELTVNLNFELMNGAATYKNPEDAGKTKKDHGITTYKQCKDYARQNVLDNQGILSFYCYFAIKGKDQFEFGVKLDVEKIKTDDTNSDLSPEELEKIKLSTEDYEKYEVYIDRFNTLSTKYYKDSIKPFDRKFYVDDTEKSVSVPYIVVNLNEDTTDYYQIVSELRDAFFILNSFREYIISGDEKLLQNIEFGLKSVETINTIESKMTLSPTMIALDKLIFEDCKQIVLTGAPGTGKTYSAQEYIKWQLMTEYIANNEGDIDTFNAEWEKSENNEGGLANRWRMVQFHPSFDYTDFVEGLRPIEKDKIMQFKRMDGIFKEFCRTVANENDDKDPKECPKRFFLIDEINRADLSKVFGELMFCLEEDYRGKSHTIKTQYSNLDTYDKAGNPISDVFKKGCYIPKNVIIIGTMNDIDRSVDTFDFALRRRFRWVNVEVNDTLLTTTFLAMNKKNGSPKTDEISGFVKSVMDMNEVFSKEDKFKRIFKTPKDYYVGPAYFKGLFKNDTKDAIWRNKIEPLLREYVRGRNEADDFIKACREAFLPETQKEKKEISKEIQDMVTDVIQKGKSFNTVDDKEKWTCILSGIATELSNYKDYGFTNKNRINDLKNVLKDYNGDFSANDLIRKLKTIEIKTNKNNKLDEFWSNVEKIINGDYEKYAQATENDSDVDPEQ